VGTLGMWHRRRACALIPAHAPTLGHRPAGCHADALTWRSRPGCASPTFGGCPTPVARTPARALRERDSVWDGRPGRPDPHPRACGSSRLRRSCGTGASLYPHPCTSHPGPCPRRCPSLETSRLCVRVQPSVSPECHESLGPPASAP
jgi:hypothetical protein